MPKTAPSLIKTVRVVISLSPHEYERWKRYAHKNEMRVPEFVRFVISQATRDADEEANVGQDEENE